MKNIILCCCAAVAGALSFFFEYQPIVSQAPISVRQTAAVFPLSVKTPRNISTGFSPLAAFSAPPASFKDTLFYNYYAQTLGVKFNYSENKQLLATVTEWLGTPYRSGGASKKGTDCSGFVSGVYQEVFGITLVHSSRAMFQRVAHIKKTAIQTGDLVFFRRGPGQPIYHVGIYLNNHKFIHSATNGGVMVSSLNQSYYAHHYYAAGRVNIF